MDNIFSNGTEGMSECLLAAISDWIGYKAEKKQAYKPKGLKGLLSETRNNAVKYGDVAVIYAINVSMAANYQGIVWDKAKDAPKEAPPERKNY